MSSSVEEGKGLGFDLPTSVPIPNHQLIKDYLRDGVLDRAYSALKGLSDEERRGSLMGRLAEKAVFLNQFPILGRALGEMSSSEKRAAVVHSFVSKLFESHSSKLMYSFNQLGDEGKEIVLAECLQVEQRFKTARDLLHHQAEAYIQSRQLEELVELVQRIPDTSPHKSKFMLNTVEKLVKKHISTSKFDYLETACRLAKVIPEKEPRLDIAKKLLDKLVQIRRPLDLSAIEAFINDHLDKDELLGILVNWCCTQREYEEASNFYQQIDKRSEIAYSAADRILRFLVRIGNVDEAEKYIALVSDADKNRAYVDVVGCFLEKGRIVDAERVVCEIADESIKSSLQYRVVSACIDRAQLADAEMIANGITDESKQKSARCNIAKYYLVHSGDLSKLEEFIQTIGVERGGQILEELSKEYEMERLHWMKLLLLVQRHCTQKEREAIFDRAAYTKIASRADVIRREAIFNVSEMTEVYLNFAKALCRRKRINEAFLFISQIEDIVAIVIYARKLRLSNLKDLDLTPDKKLALVEKLVEKRRYLAARTVALSHPERWRTMGELPLLFSFGR